jgi:N-acetylmuramoyl-L-alanine amidase
VIGVVIRVVATDTLNLRDAPNNAGNILWKIPPNAYVSVIKWNPGGWHEVSYLGKHGFVYSEYIKVAALPVGTVIGVTPPDTLNMRSNPSMDGTIIGKIPNGAAVDILEEGPWHKVIYDGVTGYCYRPYIKLPVAPPTPPTGRRRIAVLDPGHYVNHNVGVSMGYREGNWNLQYAFILKAALEAQGWKVYLTRTTGLDRGLISRGQYAARMKADLFISIHTNACGDSGVRGVGAFYSVDLPGDRVLASGLASTVAKVMGSPKYYAKVRIGGTRSSGDRDPREDYYSVIDAAQDGGVKHVILLEHDFHTNRTVCAWHSAPGSTNTINWRIHKEHAVALAKASAAYINNGIK